MIADRVDIQKLPDLSGLFSSNLSNLLLDRLVGQDPAAVTTWPESGMWTNLVRLTDMSLRQYDEARAAFEGWERHGTKGVIGYYFAGIDYLEATVTVTHRAVLYAEGLRRRGVGQSRFAVTPRQEKALRQMRNQIEHADEKFATGTIRPGQPHILNPRRTRMEFGPRTLQYQTLARCITKCYRQVEAIRGPSK